MKIINADIEIAKLKEMLKNESISDEKDRQSIRFALNVLNGAPKVDIGYQPYREETCDRKEHCNNYQHYHCIGCNNCKYKGE